MMLHRVANRRRWRTPFTSRGVVAAGGLLLAALVVQVPARAQSAGNGFLFKVPRGSVTLRGGFDHAFASSDLFSLTTNDLTVNRGDFSAFTIGGDVAFRLTPRIDAVFGSSYSGKSTPSESRDFVEGPDNLPIQQTVTFKRVPLTASARFYLASRGRAVGRFAWVPASFVPYVGIGGGAMWYRFRREGDFVDPQTFVINTDELTSDGWTPEVHATVGTEFAIGPRFAITGEAQYTWAKAQPSTDFAGFEKIDLSGIAATAGLSVRF